MRIRNVEYVAGARRTPGNMRLLPRRYDGRDMSARGRSTMGVDVKASSAVVVGTDEEAEVVLATVSGLEPATRTVTTAAVLFMLWR